MTNINTILNTLNPLNDKNEIVRASRSPLENSYPEITTNLLLRIYTLVKPIIRGGIYGATAGFITSLATGKNEVETGVAIGVMMDSFLYYPRAVFYAITNKEDK